MRLAIALLSATAALAIPAYGFAADQTATIDSKVEYKDNRGYSSTATAKQTDTNGTEKSAKQTEDVDVDSDGKVTKHFHSERAADPKGMSNEQKTVRDVKIKQKARGGYKKTVESKDMNNDGADVTAKTEANVDVDGDNNVTKTIKTEKTVDPKGLFNSKTTTTKEKIVNGRVVEEKKETPESSAK